MLSRAILWNMPRITVCIFHIITHELLVECVYEENTRDRWHVTRYPMRKHCIPMPKSLENIWKFWEELGNLCEFPKTSEALQTHF